MSATIHCKKCRNNRTHAEFKSGDKQYKTCNICRESRKITRIYIKVECPICKQMSSTQSDLKRHINAVHKKVKLFECVNCEYKCNQNATLQQHINAVHLKLTPHKCPHCEKSFTINTHLTGHIKAIHDKIKDNCCDQCDFKSVTMGGLRSHIKGFHNKIRDHCCKLCEYKCSRSSGLQRHINSVHNKIKNHRCDTCEFTCSTNSNLQNHIKLCTGELNISAGELACRRALDNMGVEYKSEVSVLKNDVGNWLRMDFEIKMDEKTLYIEFDGRQHFEPVTHFGGQEHFEKTQLHDIQKNKFCEDNGYPLLRIHYKEFGNISRLIADFVTEHTNWGCG